MKRVFLVDYENTAIRGLYGISELGYGDKVVVFCSNDNIKRALIDVLKIYERQQVEIRVHLLKKRSANALDFMITTYLGFEVSIEEEKDIFVLSADKGYESAIDMAHELSNGIFIGFHESIYDCIHEKHQRQLPDKKEVLTIDAEDTLVLEHEQEKQISGREYKAISGPVNEPQVFSSKLTIKTKKEPKSVLGLKIGGKKNAKSATKKQLDQYRRAFMERMKRENRIPENYTDQLTAFMEKCLTKDEFYSKAVVVLGNKRRDLLDTAMEYYDLFDKDRLNG